MISLGEETIAATQPRWTVLGEVVTGADHQRRGAPCQDAWNRWTDDRIVVAAVADGHGSDRHPRSEIGARVAVDVAVDELRKLAESLDGDRGSPRNDQQLSRWLSSLRNDHRLTRRLVWKWRERVLADARARSESVPADEHEVTRLYGTTLLALLVTKTYWLALQIGDGAIVGVDADGSAARVFEPDDDSFGNATHSLCSRDPVPHMRVEVRRIDAHEPNALVLFLLCTDGLEGAFVEDTRLLDLARHYLDRLRYVGKKAVEEGLQQDLNRVSERSIGDDIALALVWRAGALTGTEPTEFARPTVTDSEPNSESDPDGSATEANGGVQPDMTEPGADPLPVAAVSAPEPAESTEDQPAASVLADARPEAIKFSPPASDAAGHSADSPNPEQPHAPPAAE